MSLNSAGLLSFPITTAVLYSHMNDTFSQFVLNRMRLYFLSISSASLGSYQINITNNNGIVLTNYFLGGSGVPVSSGRALMVNESTMPTGIIIGTDAANIYSDSLLQTSLLGYRLDELLAEPINAFCVSLKTNTVANGVLVFSSVTIDTRETLSYGSSVYQIQSNGTYIFHLAVANQGNIPLIIEIQVNNVPLCNVLSSLSTPGYLDTASQTCLENLQQGDYVIVRKNSGNVSSVFSSDFFGFLYLPKFNSTFSVVWYLATNTSSSSAGLLNFEQSVVFKGIDYTIDTISIVLRGHYCLHINVATQPLSAVNLQLLKNNQPQASISSKNNNQNGIRTWGRSFLIDLDVDDVLSVNLTDGAYYSDNGRQTSFSGYILSI